MIFQLVEEGKLTLNEPLAAFFPQNPNAYKITIAQLLTHHSGIPNVRRERDLPINVNTMPMTREEMLSLIVK